MLQMESHLERMTKKLIHAEHIFFIGRGLDHALAMEGSLKLKEISYIHAEAYAAGELKHGTMSLIEEGTPVIALATQPHLLHKTRSNIAEVKARGAYVIGLVCDDASFREEPVVFADMVDCVFHLPRIHPILTPLVAAPILQLLAYHVCLGRSLDPDKPRNLAKSVTVE